MTDTVAPHLRIALAPAIMMIIVAGIVLAGMNVVAKYLALDVPIMLVVWGRYFFHTVITFAGYSAKRRSFNFLRARSPGLQFIRAATLFCATLFMYVAITRMQLGDATAIQFLSPVVVTVISGLFLGEHVGPRRWAAVVIAFVGVLLVARPGSGVLGWSALLPLATAFLLASYMVMTKIISTRDDPDTTIFYSTAVGALVLSALVPFYWQALDTFQWLLMVIMGTAGAVGHYLLVKALHSVEASMLAPFAYLQVVFAILWGFLVFGDIPSAWTLSGVGVIIGSGIYVWYRETRITRDQS